MGQARLKLVPQTETSSPTDESIKALAAENHEQAFNQLVLKYRQRIYRHALYITKDSQEAFDVAQDVFVRAYHEGRLFSDEFHMKAWLYRVCTNRCYNIVRDRQRRGTILNRLGKQETALQVHHKAIDAVLDREQSSEMARHLAKLSPEHRTILILRYYDDLSYQEMADTLQVKLGTVMSRLSRAKVRLHQLVVEGGQE